MINISIKSTKLRDIDEDKELKNAACEFNMYGSTDEIKNELRVMLEGFEKRQPLYDIWLDVLGEWASERCDK